jgi:hypothetical protein
LLDAGLTKKWEQVFGDWLMGSGANGVVITHAVDQAWVENGEINIRLKISLSPAI